MAENTGNKPNPEGEGKKPLEGYKAIPEADQKKAQTFFERGKTVADSGQYDYGIEMFLQGLAIDPDAVPAHQQLREISMRRCAGGGKKLDFLTAMKTARPTKDDKVNMLNAERLLAFDPGNTDYMVRIAQNAQKAGYYDTVMWIGPILIKANHDSKKPDCNKYLVMRDIYKSLEQWEEAVDATSYAAQLRVNDMELQTDYKNLSALVTMTRGNYTKAGKEGGFRMMMQDAAGQDKLIEDNKDVQSDAFLLKQLRDAEAQYAADPSDGKVSRLCDALERTESLENENRAAELLQEWYDKTKQYRFRLRVGKIHMRQYERQRRLMAAELKANPADTRLRADYAAFVTDQWEFELKELSAAAEQYPTDLIYRFEMAKRLFFLKRYDEAIQWFQQATNDPKHRIDASIYLSRAFLEAGFNDEAGDVLQPIIAEYQLRDDRWKSMLYWRARALEMKNESEAAIKLYSQIAQMDFRYLDVQARIKNLRAAKK